MNDQELDRYIKVFHYANMAELTFRLQGLLNVVEGNLRKIQFHTNVDLILRHRGTEGLQKYLKQ